MGRNVRSGPPTEPRDRADVACEILEEVAGYYDVTTAEIISRTREERVAMPRQVFMAVMRDYGFSTSDTARMLGRDHSTITHGVARADAAHKIQILAALDHVAQVVASKTSGKAGAILVVEQWIKDHARPENRHALSVYLVEGLIKGREHLGVAAASGLMLLAFNLRLRDNAVDALCKVGFGPLAAVMENQAARMRGAK